MGLYDAVIGLFGYERVKAPRKSSSKKKKAPTENKASKKKSARTKKVVSLQEAKESAQKEADKTAEDPSVPTAAVS